jgi:hypothetical protein
VEPLGRDVESINTWRLPVVAANAPVPQGNHERQIEVRWAKLTPPDASPLTVPALVEIVNAPM